MLPTDSKSPAHRRTRQTPLPFGHSRTAFIISSFSTITPYLHPISEIRDSSIASTEIPFTNCTTYHSGKCFGRSSIASASGSPTPPKATAASSPWRSPPQRTLAAAPSRTSLIRPPSSSVTRMCPPSWSAGYRRTAVNSPKRSSIAPRLASVIRLTSYRIL